MTSFELMLAARLQMHAAAALCMKGTSGDGFISMSISDGSPCHHSFVLESQLPDKIANFLFKKKYVFVGELTF